LDKSLLATATLEDDTEADLLAGMSHKRRLRSRFCWFPDFCKSQHFSQFTALFIVVQAETSTAESFGKDQKIDYVKRENAR
jgi:hypothetical protein